MSAGPAIAANNTDLLSAVAEGAEGAKVTEMTGTVEPLRKVKVVFGEKQ